MVKALLEDLRKVHGKTTLLYRIAEAAVGDPDGIVREVVYPVVGEQTLRDLVKEFKATGPAYRQAGAHDPAILLRQPLPPHGAAPARALEFRSNNAAHRPVIDALALLKGTPGEQAALLTPPRKACRSTAWSASSWQEIVLEKDKDGVERINRINYEICVLQALRERLRCKEIWVVGADRYRNPDEDLPAGLRGASGTPYYCGPEPARETPTPSSRSCRQAMTRGPRTLLDAGLPRNPQVQIIDRSEGRISAHPARPPARAGQPRRAEGGDHRGAGR